MSATPSSVEVMLRPARPDDRARVWEWNFAPDVRARSLDPSLVAWGDHERWFAARLAEPGAPMWIVEEDRDAVGVVRLDPRPPAPARISIVLAAEARGRGVGRRAIAAACAAWAKPILAQVLADNAVSRACFEACGFVAVDIVDRGKLVNYQWSP